MHNIDTGKHKYIYINEFIAVYTMTKKIDKMVKGVDDGVWTKFTGWCLGNRIRVGDKLSEIIRNFMKNPK